jgi:hypothetical protein
MVYGWYYEPAMVTPPHLMPRRYPVAIEGHEPSRNSPDLEVELSGSRSKSKSWILT